MDKRKGNLMNGFFNRLLIINLSDRAFKYENIPDPVLAKTLGGKGLGIHLLMQHNLSGVDAFSPDNVFIITTGPITGTRMWGQSRFGVYSKSPATGGFGESYCGGSLAPKIKGCGIDAIVIKGVCDSLSFITVNENGVLFKDASRIKEKDTTESERYILKNSDPNSSAMVIGPAGENLVKFACIKSDRWRSLGRGGMGAVLGSKNLKGLSFSGSKKARIEDENLLKKIIIETAKKGKNSPITSLFQKFGTPMQVAVTNHFNCFPTRYWSAGHFKKWENLSADYMRENFEITAHSCPPCFLRCTKRSKVKYGRHQGLEIEGPEYETIYAIGGLNEIDSLEEVVFLNDICDGLGIDTISAGNISAFAVEAFKKGKTKFKIDYNQPDRIAELYRLIAKKKDVGAIFAEGIKNAANELGLEDYAVHVKGLEPAGFDPRVLKGMGLSYATAARGACHLRGTFYKAELSGEIKTSQISGKAKLLIDYEDRAALFDCLILCRFFRDFIYWEEISALFEASTGRRFHKGDLEIIANRITQKTREYNLREGLDSSTDTLPRRFLTEPTKEGASLSTHDLNLMILEYNQIRKERNRAEDEDLT